MDRNKLLLFIPSPELRVREVYRGPTLLTSIGLNPILIASDLGLREKSPPGWVKGLLSELSVGRSLGQRGNKWDRSGACQNRTCPHILQKVAAFHHALLSLNKS